jgi:hypothetical protein
MYAVLLIFLLILYTRFSISSVLSADDGFFVVPEDEFFNPEDYDRNSPLLSERGNYSDQSKSQDGSKNTNPEQITGSINLLKMIYLCIQQSGYKVDYCHES